MSENSVFRTNNMNSIVKAMISYNVSHLKVGVSMEE